MGLPLKVETETLKESVSKFSQFLLSVIFEAFPTFFPLRQMLAMWRWLTWSSRCKPNSQRSSDLPASASQVQLGLMVCLPHSKDRSISKNAQMQNNNKQLPVEKQQLIKWASIFSEFSIMEQNDTSYIKSLSFLTQKRNCKFLEAVVWWLMSPRGPLCRVLRSLGLGIREELWEVGLSGGSLGHSRHMLRRNCGIPTPRGPSLSHRWQRMDINV